MSAYDDAVAYLDAEVHPRCDYDIYSGMRDIVDEMEAENAKLRELADAVKVFVEDSPCEDCLCRRDCYDNNRIFCANTFSYNAFAAMRKLGIEVG